MSKRLISASFLVSLSAILALTGLTSCTGKGPFSGKLFKERASETPAPSEETIDKSFFVEPSGKPKTFMCAYAAEMLKGFAFEDYSLLVNETPHCNIEFEIHESSLVGKLVNPSFLNDRSRWLEFVRIPINRHFYYEREKDQHGRETNRWIKNDSRSHWSARPKIELDLSKVAIGSLGKGLGRQESSAYDIEWDSQNNFLGFTVDIRFVGPNFGGDLENQVKMRFNFLKFDHDPTFEKVPYHQENSRLMNVLHVMGRQVEGIEPELYTAHWDLRKTNVIYLNGVPKEHEKTVLDAIDKWNETYRRIGAIGPTQVAFKGEVKNLKHPFDLRYPTFNWIADPMISTYSPLGIGMAHADVRNGKIMWGSVSIYGGMLERYVNAYTPLESAMNSGAKTMGAMSPVRVMADLMPKSFPPVNGMDQINVNSRPTLLGNLVNDQRAFLQNRVNQLAKSNAPGSAQEAAALKEQLEKFQAQDPGLNKIVQDLIQQANLDTQKVRNQFANNQNLGTFFGTSMLKEASEHKATSANEMTSALQNMRPGADFNAIRNERNLTRRQQLLSNLANKSSAMFVEEGLTAAKMAGSWMNSEARQTRTYPEMLDSVIMDLTLHELGHFMGLGHQFKENILPPEGTVPSRFSKSLTEKATKEKGWTNYTSVMGYRSGRTEMILPAKDLNPGPHDELVLRAIYKSEYSVLDREADDFVFVKIPVNGKIPMMSQTKNKAGQTKFLPVSYFPACNDYEASYGADPFCNRWDRGNTAEEVMGSYFEHISDNLLSNLYSMVGGGGSDYRAEAYLWHSAFDSFSRVRMFYDEMRRRLRSDAELKPLWNQLRTDKKALLEFSQGCQKEDPTGFEVSSDILRKIFKNKGIVDLCRANAKALSEFKFFLNLPDADYTRIDHNNRYIQGGYLAGDTVRNAGHMFGSWYQLANLPLKLASLYSVTSANPYMMYGWWLGPNFYYESEENRFLYRTLYPREYTQLISETVQHNMRFAATGLDDTTKIGRSVLASGWLMPFGAWNSNDSARLPREYNDLLNQQTEFQYSMVAVLISPVQPDSRSNVKAEHYKKFTATIYDFMTGKPTTVRDVFLLPRGDVFVSANNMFIYPITKLKFYSGKESYVIAYKVSYDYEEGDELVEDSIKSALMEKHEAITRLCINGFNGNGLATFFDSSVADFDGFFIPPGIAEEAGKEKMGLFYKSIDEAYAKYELKAKDRIPENFPLRSMRRVCDETMRGIGQLSASSAMINGFWLGITHEYLEK